MRIGVILGTARIGATRRIVVFGNHGSGNLGDEATLQALIEQLRARLPKLEIVSFSVNPADTAARYGIRAEPATRRSTRFRPSSDSAVPSRKDRIEPDCSAARLSFGSSVASRMHPRPSRMWLPIRCSNCGASGRCSARISS